MKLNLPNRQSHRLRGYDYSTAGCYFVTICTDERKRMFGEIKNGVMYLSEKGQIVNESIMSISMNFENVRVIAACIMPDHIHLLLKNMSGIKLGDIVRRIKTAIYQKCLRISKERNETLGKMWQRDYFDRIVMTQEEREKTINYILTNPQRWGDR